ncbi:lipoprotein N-acyltransferase Lnb domain-containing protein [Poritiphilus flavus]|uniref:DUF4105 domain-containing protein n=1 Tax=Poritiphilus flavus TaxID=2697053 RepID=A0A6L9EA52_9FLAO|nr:DUF4105 domain-containing protein [Poritiphilus flavus]NAS11339.1 DUF4105 domain-containing protein [Poritiphilus flavus]
MLRKIAFFLILLWASVHTYAQSFQLSPNAQISVLTCGTGEELYAAFGHTAIRVQDPARELDWVYNYGTFNFNTPNFYMKFARGKLLYSLSKTDFTNFLYTYQLENRWVKEQILQLKAAEKMELFNFLEENAKPENKYYKYDFLFDNCATKIPAVLKMALGDKLVYDSKYLEDSATFRQLIQQHLKANSWSSLGIDLALGAVIDRKATTLEHTFLPEFVYRQLQNTTLTGARLVERERVILDIENTNGGYYFTTSPLFWLLIFMLFTATITHIDLKNHARSRWLDFFIFFVTGIAGLLMLFLWFLTDHSSTAYNFNVFWAFPLNCVACFYLFRNGKPSIWLKKYLSVLLIFLGLTVVFWISGVQRFAPLVSLILLTLAIRYLFLYHHFNKSA